MEGGRDGGTGRRGRERSCPVCAIGKRPHATPQPDQSSPSPHSEEQGLKLPAFGPARVDLEAGGNEKGSAPFCKLHPFPPASTHSSLLPFREPPPGCCHIPSNTAPAPPGPSSAPGWEPQRFKLFLDKLPPPEDSSQGEAAPAPPGAACGKRPIKTSAAWAGCQAGSRR